MGRRYFLMNGKLGISDTVNLNFDNKLKSEFEDIALLDLATLDIYNGNVRNSLKEYNTSLPLDGQFYIASYLESSNTVYTYAPAFNIFNDKCRKYLDYLRSLAINRINNINSNKFLKLKYEGELIYFVQGILSDIIENKYEDIFKDTVVDERIELIYKIRYSKKCKDLSISTYLNMEEDMIKNIFNDYTTLRNLMITYTLFLDGKRIDFKNALYTRRSWDNRGIQPLSMFDPIKYADQMELSDYLNNNVTRVRRK